MPEDDLEDRVTRLEYGLWGLRGDNGIVSEVKAIRSLLEAEQKEKLSGQRALVLALLAAVIALVGTVASLAVALSI